MNPRRHHRGLALAAALAIILLLCSACSSSDDDGDGSASDTTAAPESTTTTAPAPAQLDVTSSNYQYDLGSDSVPAGLVTVTQHNDGDEAHQVTLIKLEDGQTADQLATALAGSEGDHAAADDAYAGGPNAIDPGGSNSATVSLEEGNYALICFIPAADGQSHFQKGMVGQLSVTAPEGAEAAPPETEGTIHMADYTYDVPDDFTGQGTYEVVNDGPQVHELTITTDADTADGGLAAIAPGATAYVDFDLAPKDYSFLCFVSDKDTGAPHFTLGMNVPVTVGGTGSGGGGSGATTTTAGGATTTTG